MKNSIRSLSEEVSPKGRGTKGADCQDTGGKRERVGLLGRYLNEITKEAGCVLTIIQVTETYTVGEEGSEMSSFGVLSVGNPGKIL